MEALCSNIEYLKPQKSVESMSAYRTSSLGYMTGQHMMHPNGHASVKRHGVLRITKHRRRDVDDPPPQLHVEQHEWVDFKLWRRQAPGDGFSESFGPEGKKSDDHNHVRTASS
jgi:hypothetical protein